MAPQQYATCHHSRYALRSISLRTLFIICMTDPLALPTTSFDNKRTRDINSFVSCATSTVTSLKSDLTKERTTNARVLEYAEAEILRLQAQVARRDAELEACVVHSHEPFSPDGRKPVGFDVGRRAEDGHPAQKIGSERKKIDVTSVSHEQTRQIMWLVNSRNELLEADVQRLSDCVSTSSGLISALETD